MKKIRILMIWMVFMLGFSILSAKADDYPVMDEEYYNKYYMDIKIEVIWSDDNNADKMRPRGVVVTITQDGEWYGSQQIWDDDNWERNYSAYRDGNYNISVDNSIPSGYTAETQKMSNQHFRVIFRHTHTCKFTKKEPYGEYYLAQAATCTEGDKWWYACTICDAASTTSMYTDGDPLGHSWRSADYEWSEDNRTCTATRVCYRDDSHIETETVNTTSEVTQSRTCMLPELTTYTASFKNSAFSKSRTKEVQTADKLSTAHKWGEPFYMWVSADKICTALRSCEYASGHMETESVTASAVITQNKTCVLPELTSLTAQFKNTAFKPQTLEVQTSAADADAHSWGEPAYSWAEDYSTCTAERICNYDSTHVESETVNSSYEITQEKTCELPELTACTAAFANTAFAAQTETDVKTAEATGHDWNISDYICDFESRTCTTKYICKNDSSHTDTEVFTDEEDQIYEWEIRKETGCSEEGLKVQICTNCKTELQQETIPAHGNHVWDTVNTMITKEPTCLAAGVKTYSCTNCIQTKTESIPKLNGTVAVTQSSIKLQVKDSVNASQLISGLMPGDYIQNVTTSNEKIVSVSKSGSEWMIQGEKKSDKAVDVTIQLASGASAKISFTIQKAAVKTTKLTVTNVKKKKLTMEAGDTFMLNTAVEPLTTTDKLKFKTSDKKIVAVNDDGKLTAKKAGKAAITITSGKKSYKLTVTVKKKAAEDFKLYQSKLKIKAGKSETLNVIFAPKNSEGKVEFTTSNKKTAAVSASGKVKGIKKGKATITATMTLPSGEKIVRTCKVTIKK